MEPDLRRAGLIGLAAAMALALGLFVLEHRDLPPQLYTLRDGRSAPSPSPRMDALERAGERRFYSQLGQDKWLLGEVFPGVADGWFVDVGAWDAVVHSNTKALEEAGWTGACVDPFPRNWRGRRCQLFEEVAYSTAGETVRFKMAGIVGGIQDHLRSGRKKVDEAKTVELVTVTLADILRRAGAPPYIHYLSLDTEGSEYEILRVFPFGEYRFGALTIEHNEREPARTQMRELLEANGYRFARMQLVDDWYLGDPTP